MRAFRLISLLTFVLFTGPSLLAQTATFTGTIHNFGSQLVGVTTSAQTITLTNTGASTLTISETFITGTGFASTNTCANLNNSLAPQQNCTISLTFTAPSVGPFAGTLSVITNDAATPVASYAFGGTGSTSALNSIAIAPANPSIIAALTQQFIATGTYADSSTQDLSKSAVWTTSSAATATIDNNGLATGAAVGTTAVHATSGSITVSTNLTVNAPVLIGVSVSPGTAFLIVGQTRQFAALAIFNNGTTQNISSNVTWTSSSPANATISASGLGTGKALGSSTITATDGSLTAFATITVTPAGFVNTGSLNVGRLLHTATLLNNGKILVTGGEDASGNLLSSSELYDPAAGTFAFTGSMTTVRAFHTATLLNSGKVLIVGGGGTTAELYDPATGTFTATGSLTSFAIGNTATLLKNGKVLITGGESTSGTGLTSAELYDPATGVFSSTGNMITGRMFQIATLLDNGQVVVAGGESTSGTLLTSAELYNPATGTFSATGNLNGPSFFFFGTGTLLNTGSVLISGGQASSDSQFELYNPTNGTFTNTGGQNGFAFDNSATLLNNGTVLLSGGENISGTSLLLNGASIYDPTSDTTTPTGDLNTGRFFGTATLLNTGKVLVVGGEGINSTSTTIAIASAELYTPSSLTPANLTSIAVTPASPSIHTGASQQFTATGTFVGGVTQTLNSVTWISSNTAVASITNGGTNGGAAFGLTAGSTTITACAGGACGATALSVTSGATPTLVSITVTPASPSIPKGTQEQFAATGHFSDGSTMGLTNVTWSSGTTAVATISSAGLATAVTAGASTIAATSGNIAGSTVLTVTAPILVSIAVTPANSTIAAGLTRQFTATGTFSDNSTQNLTGTAAWTSSTPAAATINSAGLATAVAVGTTTIAAKSGTITGTTILSVTAATLASIAVTPTNSTIAAGLTRQFTATGTFSNGTTQNLTSSVAWASNTPATATINSAGLATSVAVGTTTISAVSGNIAGTTLLSVSAPTLVSIAVTPVNATLTRGATMQYTATGTFSNNTTQNISGSVTWSSTNIAAASISGTGLATSVVALNVASSATTIRAVSGTIMGSTTLTAVGPTLTSIAVTPANSTMTAGLTRQFTATGTFSDGSAQSITGSVGWGSTVAVTATINAAGLATAVSVGTTKISAIFGPIAGSTNLTVTSSGSSCVASPPGLVSWYTGDGTTADFLGANPPVASNAVTFVAGEVAQGFTLSTGGFLDILPTASLNSQQVTLSAWVRPDGSGPNNDSFGSFIVGQSVDSSHEAVDLFWSASSNKFIFAFGADATELIKSTDVFPPGQFYFVAGTYDGSTFKLYVNGVLEGQFAEVKTIAYSSSVDWTIGSQAAQFRGTGFPRTWNGVIDEVQVFNRALNSAEIQGIVAAGSAGECKQSGPAAPAIGLNPGSLTFAMQVIGTTSAAETITVSNSGNAALTINSIALTGTNPAEFKETNNCPLPPATLGAGTTCAVQASFAPLAIGTRTANVTFTDNTGGVAGSTQNVGLTGGATAPAPTATTVQLSYPVGTNVSQVATINCPSNTVPCTDPNAHSLKLVVSQVLTPFTLTVTAFEVPLSQADGVCPAGATETTDFDCRFKSTFTLQTEPNGDVIVPQCYPFSNGNCVYYRISNVPPQSSYVGPVFENFSWNNNAYVPSSFYAANNPRLFDDPDAPPFDVNHQFVFDITDFFESSGNKVGVDPTIHGHTKQYNDFVVAFTAALPNPALTLTFAAPLGTGSPSFQQGAPVPVAFTLFQITNPITDAVTSPNAVSIGLANATGTRFAALAPDGTAAAFTFNPTAGQYVLSLATSALPPGVYTLLVNSNLFVQQTTTFAIVAAPLAITTASPLAAGTAGVAYSQTLAAAGGVPPYTWTVTSGMLPAGLNLSAAGVISGPAPTAVTGDSFTVQVKDSTAVTAAKQFALTIGAPTLVSIAVTPANPTIVSGATEQFTATGTFSNNNTQNITGSVTWSSSATAVATITAAGLAHGVTAGPTTIRALSANISGTTTLTVTSAGVPDPLIGLNPIILTFANQVISTASAAQTITVSNTGTAALTINSIALSGTNPAEFKETNNCPVSPATLSAGQSCAAQVSFVPLAVGTRSANVTFTDNTGGVVGSTQNVGVSGTASAPPPTTTTVQLTYPVGTNVSEVATLNCPSNTVPCVDANAHSLKLVVSQVLTPFTLTVTAFEVPLSQADGVCPAGVMETTDFDCRFKSTFTLQTETNGDVVVPQCIPFSNGNCVFYRISNVPPQSSYVGPVFENFSWNNNAFVPSSFYAPNNPRLFDDPDAPPFDVNHQFVFDITDFFESSGNKVGADPTIHGHTKQYNDFVVAFTAALPNPALTLAFQPPLGTGSPSFAKGATIPVAFTLKQGTTTITNAVTSPNAVSIGLANAQGARFAALAPDGTPAAFTFNTTSQQYSLSLATQTLPAGMYTLFVNSNLFVQQSTTFTVTPANLVSIAVTPANPSIPQGNTQQFTAVGTFSDGSIQTLNGVTWTSSFPQEASINASGLAAALSIGTVSMTATSGGISGATTLKVTTSTPQIAAKVLATGTASGSFFVDLQLTNTGVGTAKSLKLSTVAFRTLTGNGTVTYNAQLSPKLPDNLGDLAAGSSATIRLFLSVPSTVSRFSVSESGSFGTATGQTLTFASVQAVSNN